VWGCFSWSGVDALVQIDGIMNGDKYIKIINERSSCENERLEEEFIFQQDNDSKHTIKKIKEIFLGFKHQIVGMTCTKSGFESYRKLMESIGLESARGTNKNDCFKNI